MRLESEVRGLTKRVKEMEIKSQEAIEFNENSALEWKKQNEGLMMRIEELEEEVYAAKD